MKIAVLVSGGVDSSVALKLLKNAGHVLEAFYLKIWLEDELSYLGNCPWEEDLFYVRQICEKEKIPLKIVSLQKEYWKNVVAYTISELKKGRTPNPDMLCNQQIKFGFFYDRIDGSFEKVATGHYARVKEDAKGAHLFKAKDSFKDQTYFLAALKQQQLKRALFPIGDYLKKEVRILARSFDLPNQSRKDSQGICFLGKIPFRDFVSHHLGIKKGEIVEEETGKIIGEHNGYWFYTLGQRKGICLPGGPYYVVRKDCEKNIIFVSKFYFSSDKKRNYFETEKPNWINSSPKTKNVWIKLRHGEKFYRGQILNVSPKGLSVKFSGKDQGISPGQFAVFYSRKECLGGAIIK